MIDIEKIKQNIDKALIFSRIFKTKDSKYQKTLTKERTTNLFGRTFDSLSALREMMIDRNKYGYNLLEVVLRFSFDGIDVIPVTLRLWHKAGIR